jgi:hypothetical protein
MPTSDRRLELAASRVMDRPTEISREAVAAAFRAAGGEREQSWDARSAAAKDAYVRRLREGASEPAELAVLLGDSELAERWANVPWLLRAEYVAWINSARTGFTRRRRAAFALKNASGERP